MLKIKPRVVSKWLGEETLGINAIRTIDSKNNPKVAKNQRKLFLQQVFT